MTVDEIRQSITAATGAKTTTRLYPHGLAVGVQVYPGLNHATWGLVPIDDESRGRFVEFLVAEWRKEVALPPARVWPVLEEDPDKRIDIPRNPLPEELTGYDDN